MTTRMMEYRSSLRKLNLVAIILMLPRVKNRARIHACYQEIMHRKNLEIATLTSQIETLKRNLKK